MAKKHSSFEMKDMIRKMRNANSEIVESAPVEKKPVKNLSVRDMLKITRRLNEDTQMPQPVDTETKPTENKTNPFDQKREEDKFRAFFGDLNVSIRFIPLEVTETYVFWGGTIDGMIQFTYTVTEDEKSSGVEFNYLQDFTVDNPENQEIIGRVESYYDTFYKYWRNNMLEP